MIKVICVCLGNICRSPVAEALLREQFVKQGYVEGTDFMVDSAGTGDWHIGHPPDARSQQVCERHGIDITAQRARKFIKQDGKKYTAIFGMDKNNLDNIKQIIVPEYYPKVALFDAQEVNDPYYGILDGFEIMYQQLERAAEKIVSDLTRNPNLD